MLALFNVSPPQVAGALVVLRRPFRSSFPAARFVSCSFAGLTKRRGGHISALDGSSTTREGMRSLPGRMADVLLFTLSQPGWPRFCAFVFLFSLVPFAAFLGLGWAECRRSTVAWYTPALKASCHAALTSNPRADREVVPFES
jgi:hypothetical protein